MSEKSRKSYQVKIELSKDSRANKPGDVDALDYLTPEELAYHLRWGHIEEAGAPEPLAPVEDEDKDKDKPAARKRSGGQV